MQFPSVRLDKGIHVQHLFYEVQRSAWQTLPDGESARVRTKLEHLCAAYAAPSHPRLTTYANVGGKCDLVFLLFAADLVELCGMHRALEQCFPPGALARTFSYLSVTELPDYLTTEDDLRRTLQQEKFEPGTEAFEEKFAELRERQTKYEHYRLYPEMPDWEVMAFYPMSKRRGPGDNWYLLEFDARKQLMGGHARVGRRYAGRISQLITGSTGLDDWEWGVTLMAHQLDALKEIVYEMRFDEVSARYGEFGPFFINLRLAPAALWEFLRL